MQVIYNNKSIKNNEYLKVNETQMKPKIKYIENNSKFYTLVMFDPDTISGTHIHWIVTNIIGNNISSGTTIIPYKGPAPPPKTGKHRYVFELYNQPKLIDIGIQERNISMNDLRKILSLTINNLLYKKQFISQNMSAGKKTRCKRNKHNLTKKLKK